MKASGIDTRNWPRIALWLVVATMAYNTIEAGIALWSGVTARSIALVGFGLDSIIEFTAAGILLWRLSAEIEGAHSSIVQARERLVHRFVGATFIALALYVVVEAGLTLWHNDPPGESIIGIVLAAASLVIMPIVSWGKFRAAKEIGSAALRAEAKETLACSYLSLTLLLGLVANASGGWWWADPVAALVMVPWLIKEGAEGLQGEEDSG